MLWRKVGKVLLLAGAGFLGLVLLLMLGVKVALDRAPKYQAEIKDWVHDRIGYRIAFQHVSPAFRWYGPELYFDRLELRSKDGERVLARAAGGRIGADIWQLVRSGKLFAGRIELDSPNISITRTGADKFALASEIELGGGDSSLMSLKFDDLPAGTLAIRGGLIRIQNWNAALPEFDLRDVNLNLSRGYAAATVAFAARFPAMLGGDISVNGAAHGQGGLNTLNWTALARAHDLSLAGWRKLLPEYLTRLSAGAVGFDVAARGRGPDLIRADLDFGAAGLMIQLTDEPSVKFERIAGALSVTHAGERWTLLGRRVRALRLGRRDPDSDFDVSWRGSDAGLLELHARASYLRAETLLPLAGLLPQKDLRERLQELAPTGEWQNTHVDLIRTTMSDPWRLNLLAQFRGVGFAAAGRAPGLRGLSGTIAGTDSGGRVDIDTQSGVFTWPAQLAQAIDLEVFKSTLYWKRTTDGLLVATPSLSLKTHDAALQGRAAWHRPSDGGSPVLTLATAVDDGNAANTRAYLPRALLPPRAFEWLDRAFVAGHLTHADVAFQGPVRHFPFRDGSGLFLVRAHLEGLTLDYREGWPRAENLAGEAEFRNEGLTVQLLKGNIGGITLDHGTARFVDFKSGELQIKATGQGDAADALGYLQATPLDALAEHLFSGVEAKGRVQGDVDLFLPFKEFTRRRILVHAHLNGVSLNRPGSTLTATELSGDADIDGAQVSHAEVRGKLLGGSFVMQDRASRSRPLTRTVLVFNGTFSGDALHAALSLPANIPIGGSTDWHGVLRVAAEPVRERGLRLSSSLAGLEFNLPEPLAKPAGRPLPSSLEIQWPVSGGPQLRLTLGSVLRGQANLDSDANGPTLVRAAVAFGGSEPFFSDTQVVNTGGTIERLDLAGWLKLYSPDKNARPLTNFLRSATFEVARVDYLGLSFLDVSVDLAATDTGWRIGVGGPNVVGSIALPGGADTTEPWNLEFRRLKFVTPTGESRAELNVAADPGGTNPRRVPAINFHAGEMIWDDRQFGDVRFSLTKLDDGISLRQLSVAGTNFTATAIGEWRGKEAGIGRLEGTLASTDVGGTLKQLGYAPVIEARTGKIDFDLRWAGAPTAATGRGPWCSAADRAGRWSS